MMWLAWRQFRTAALTMSALTLAILLPLAATGPHLNHLFTTQHLNHCGTPQTCTPAREAFFTAIKADTSILVIYFTAIVMLYLLPALLGLFWGAPLASRETETGTLRLAWTQSVTRHRWLTVKLAAGATAATILTGLLSWAVTWWSTPIDQAAHLAGGEQGALPNHFNPVVFGARGIAPVAVAVFGYLIGVTAGLLLRRTLPALAATLVVLAAVQIAVPVAVRQHYAAPERTSVPLIVDAHHPGLELSVDGPTLHVQTPVDVPGAWVFSVHLTDATGAPFHAPAPQACQTMTDDPTACFAAINALHLRQTADYQPGTRFAQFQAEETALYLLLSLALAGVCLRRVRTMAPA
ncbi:MAG: transporter [Catenulispora sp.]|nr:transporter [Catenulispora sp.]